MAEKWVKMIFPTHGVNRKCFVFSNYDGLFYYLEFTTTYHNEPTTTPNMSTQRCFEYQVSSDSQVQ